MTKSILEQQAKKRWLYVVTGVMLLLFLGLIYAWSVFRIPLENEFGWSKAETSVTFSISMIMFCLGGLVSGMINGKRGPRFTLVICAAFLAAGFAGASRIQSLMGIYITYGGLCGFGVGLGYNAVISTVVKWFPDKQGLISGMALMGFGFGGMLLGTLGARLITLWGWRPTFLVFAAAFAIIVLLSALILRPASQSFIDHLASESRKSGSAYENVPWREMLQRRNFWLYFIYAFILSAAGLAVINISANYAGDILGGDLTQAAAVAGIISVANGIGRVISGQLFDMKGYRVTMIFICLIFVAAGGTLLLSEQSRSLFILVVAFVLVGLGYGGVPPINSAFTARFFGSTHYPLNYSIMNLCILPASVLGPTCANGSYEMTFILIIAFAAVSFLLLLSIKRPGLLQNAGNDGIYTEN